MFVQSSLPEWWRNLKVQQKVWSVLILLLIPLLLALGWHLYLVNRLLNFQSDRHAGFLVLEQVHTIRRIAIDIEDAFRGYVLTEQEKFLAPLREAESKLPDVVRTIDRLSGRPMSSIDDLRAVIPRLEELLRSKHELISEIESGRQERALAYIRSGQGLVLSDALRKDLWTIEDRLDRDIRQLNDRTEALSKWTFTGLWFAVAGVVVLGLIGSRMLARSITDPIARLQLATTSLSEEVDPERIRKLLIPAELPCDELGLLAVSYQEMACRINRHIRELETLEAIGKEINTIGPDGLDGVLRRIADRAVDLAEADVCLVLIRNESMGCWIVEAASGEWNDRLKNSVMLWEELPVSVEAYQTSQPAFGERFRSDERPQVLRRNLIGDSMFAIPLLAQGKPFGVLALLSERHRTRTDWNQRLAVGMAQEAAVALANARLYETAQQEQRGLAARLRQLEYLAETLAHDLQGPGARMGELAKLLTQQLAGRLDERTSRWLALIQENGDDIARRVEGILSVARVGAGQGSVTAVDPKLVIDDVLKAQAGEIDRLRATVHVAQGFPLVACHGAYLRQLFDNLVSNALKYARPGEPPVLTISSQTGKHMVCFAVHDRGIGIPFDQRSRVFQPFVRLGRIEASGSGIGLAIVQRITELYGGRVWIEGAEGEGCTVKFTIPSLTEEGRAGFPGRRDSGILEVVDMPTEGFV